MDETVLVVILLAAWIVERLNHLFAQRAWLAERRDLLNRVQAPSLAHYVAASKVAEQPRAPAPVEQADEDDRTEIRTPEYAALHADVEAGLSQFVG